MLINRNNYETFFLLYADNELCAEDRKTVENFVTENEDLRGELEMTLAAILPEDEFAFTLKDSLYKNSFVDGSLQESLLLKVDNELSATELEVLNKSIASNPSALKEEQILSAIKLDATDIISCPQKELLYKKERGNVVVFRIVRWAAAAILIGFGLFFGLSIYNKEDLPTNTVATTQPIKANNYTQGKITKVNEEAVTSTTKQEGKKESDQAQNAEAPSLAAGQKKQVIKNLVENKEEASRPALAANNDLQKKISSAEKVIIKPLEEQPTSLIAKVEKIKEANKVIDNIVPLETSYVQASFTENETSSNKILYMDEEDVKRSKVGTAFKKFKRMIERTAKIKTGNPIRIAGFQIGAD